MLVLDPVCVSQRGHNLPLLLDYRGWLSTVLGTPVQVHVASRLPEEVCARHDLHGTLPFPYEHNLQLMRNLHLETDETAFVDPTSALAAALQRVVAGRPSPLLIMPFADYYGVMACREVVAALPAGHRTGVALRFIGVMEYAAPEGVDPMSSLRGAIQGIRASGCTLSLSAESAPLAAELTGILGEHVDLTPALAPAWLIDPPAGTEELSQEPFVYCPGSGRDDKGFADLPDIVRVFRERYPNSPLRFVCQEPAPSLSPTLHLAHMRLQALPGVTVLPSIIDREEMARLYHAASFALLPYDPTVYRLRGSASLADAFAAGSPVVTLTGTGLESFVSHYGIGRAAATLDELVDCCHALSVEGRSFWRQRGLAAHRRYEQDCLTAWSRWLETAVAA